MREANGESPREARSAKASPRRRVREGEREGLISKLVFVFVVAVVAVVADNTKQDQQICFANQSAHSKLFC